MYGQVHGQVHGQALTVMRAAATKPHIAPPIQAIPVCPILQRAPTAGSIPASDFPRLVLRLLLIRCQHANRWSSCSLLCEIGGVVSFAQGASATL